jgi:hypothetical protein
MLQPPSGEAEDSAPATAKCSLAVLSVFKQETTTMPEWIEHYLWQVPRLFRHNAYSSFIA